MVAPGTRVELHASGYGGTWSVFGNAWPSQLQAAIATQLVAEGFTVLQVQLTTGADSSIVAHQFPFKATIVVVTLAAYTSMAAITAGVRAAVSRAQATGVTVSNLTAGDAAHDDPSSFLPALNLSLGLVAVILLAGVYLVRKL